jgi:hypothetical protein
MSTTSGCARAVVELGDRLGGLEGRLGEVADSLQDTTDALAQRVASLERALHARATAP